MMRYRKIKCPEMQDGVMYRLENETTGEIRECADIAPLLRCLTDELGEDSVRFGNRWTFELVSTNA